MAALYQYDLIEIYEVCYFLMSLISCNVRLVRSRRMECRGVRQLRVNLRMKVDFRLSFLKSERTRTKGEDLLRVFGLSLLGQTQKNPEGGQDFGGGASKCY